MVQIRWIFKKKAMRGGRRPFLRDHIRTRTHTSVEGVRVFKKIRGGEEEEGKETQNIKESHH